MRKKIFVLIVTFLMLVLEICGTATFVMGTEVSVGTYTGTLSVPKTFYNLKIGDYVLDGSNVWTIQEATKVTQREGLICIWEHDGKSEGLADYSSGLYPDYKHYCENSAIFAPCYIILYEQNEKMYTTYEEFRTELGKLYAIAGAATKVESYNGYYAKSAGSTNFVFQNGNLLLRIPIQVGNTGDSVENGELSIPNNNANSNQTDSSIGNQTDSSNGNQTDGSIGNQTDGSIGNQTDGSIGNQTDGSIGNQTDSSLANQLETPINNQIDSQIINQADGSNPNQTDDSIDSSGNNSENLISESTFASISDPESAGFEKKSDVSDSEKQNNSNTRLRYVFLLIPTVFLVGGILYFFRRKRKI